jgi:hypothetical protein
VKRCSKVNSIQSSWVACTICKLHINTRRSSLHSCSAGVNLTAAQSTAHTSAVGHFDSL